jgi:hypothetical protein
MLPRIVAKNNFRLAAILFRSVTNKQIGLRMHFAFQWRLAHTLKPN